MAERDRACEAAGAFAAAGEGRQEGATPFRTAWWQRLAARAAPTYELDALRRPPAPRVRVPRGVRVARGAARPAPRLARAPASGAVSRVTRGTARRRRLLAAPDALLVRVVRRGAPRGVRDRRRALGGGPAGATHAVAAARPLGALPVVRPRRPDLLRLRLGVSAPRDGLPRGLLVPRSSWRCRPFPAPPRPIVVVWLLRWLVFRVMLGAALIKLRSDPCWRDFTCLDFHFETQPNPNPLSSWLHHAPHAVHVAGVLFEPLRRARRPVVRVRRLARSRHLAGAAARRRRPPRGIPGDAHRQREPLVPQLAHDRPGARLLRRRASSRGPCPRALAKRAARLARFAALAASRGAARTSQALALVVGILSVGPVANLRRPTSAMNTSFDPFDAREHLRRVRQRRPRALRGHPRGHARRPSRSRRRLGGVRAPVHAGRPARGGRASSPRTTTGSTGRCGSSGTAPRAARRSSDEPWLVHLVWQLLRGEPGPGACSRATPFRAGRRARSAPASGSTRLRRHAGRTGGRADVWASSFRR